MSNSIILKIVIFQCWTLIGFDLIFIIKVDFYISKRNLLKNHQMIDISNIHLKWPLGQWSKPNFEHGLQARFCT